MNASPLICLTMLIVIPVNSGQNIDNEWTSRPRPKFPPAALKQWSEGSVKLRLVFANNGTVVAATITKSSGDLVLDQAAQSAVLKWKLNPGVIKPADLAKGRDQVITFKQQPPAAALYRDGTVYTNQMDPSDLEPNSLDSPEYWMYAPGSTYPPGARQRGETGNVTLSISIGKDGRVDRVQVLRPSGYADLDNKAVSVARQWRAHRRFAGRTGTLHFDFTIKD